MERERLRNKAMIARQIKMKELEKEIEEMQLWLQETKPALIRNRSFNSLY